MATVAEVKREREAPLAATIELTGRELHLFMEWATAEKVACDREAAETHAPCGEAAVYTLAEKVQRAFREAPDASGEAGE